MHGIQLHSPAPSIGLAYLGAYLKRHGLDYQAIDACGLALDRVLPYEGSDNIYVQGLSVDEVIDFYSPHDKSYAKALTPRQLYRWMLWLYVNFYVLSFVRRPVRLLKNLWEFLVRGVENTRYMRLLKDLLVKRRYWRKIAIRTGDA